MHFLFQLRGWWFFLIYVLKNLFNLCSTSISLVVQKSRFCSLHLRIFYSFIPFLWMVLILCLIRCSYQIPCLSWNLLKCDAIETTFLDVVLNSLCMFVVAIVVVVCIWRMNQRHSEGNISEGFFQCMTFEALYRPCHGSHSCALRWWFVYMFMSNMTFQYKLGQQTTDLVPFKKSCTPNLYPLLFIFTHYGSFTFVSLKPCFSVVNSLFGYELAVLPVFLS